MLKPQNKIIDAVLGKNTESENDYFAAIGRLVTEYAVAEAAAFMLTLWASKLPEENARIIFGGMRFSDLKERLVRLIAAHHPDFSDELDKNLKQLNIIGIERDKLAHRSVAYYDKIGVLVSNAMTAKYLERAEAHIFSIEQLEAMRTDCSRIFLRLLFPVYGSRLDLDAQNYLFRPWSYKPALPKKPSKHQNRGARTKHPHPPESSHE